MLRHLLSLIVQRYAFFNARQRICRLAEFVRFATKSGESYRLDQWKPWTFGTDPAATAALEASARDWGVPLSVEGHNLKWEGLQMKLIAFRDFIRRESASLTYIYAGCLRI